MVRAGLILNCPVTIDDINCAEKIYGPNIAALKFKTVRRKSEQVSRDYIKVPPQIVQANNIITIAADILFVNKIPHFASISRNIKFTTVQHISSRNIQQNKKYIKTIVNIYSMRGFRVETAIMDGEFLPLQEDLIDMGITLNPCAANEHVPDIERQIRVMKDRTRYEHHTLPFDYIPKLMTVELLRNAVLQVSSVQGQS